jgi:flagellar protein FlgJ
MIKGIKFFKYKLYAYFRKYETPEESFTDHAEFLIKNRRYFKAMLVAADPYKFTDELVKAGYATGQGYKNLMYSLIKTIQRYM